MTGDRLMERGLEEHRRCLEAVTEKLLELTDLSRERAEYLAASVCGCIRCEEDGMLVFSDEENREVLRLPYSAFRAALGDVEEDDDDETSGVRS